MEGSSPNILELMGLFTWIFQRPPCWEYEWVFAVVISYPRHKGFSKASPLGNDVVIPVSGLQPRVAVLQREPAAPAAQWWYLEVLRTPRLFTNGLGSSSHWVLASAGSFAGMLPGHVLPTYLTAVRPLPQNTASPPKNQIWSVVA